MGQFLGANKPEEALLSLRAAYLLTGLIKISLKRDLFRKSKDKSSQSHDFDF